MEEEMKRLEVLNSYFLLDSQGEEEFDRITRLGAQVFDVPICLISLVDLGRQWFLSKVGLDAEETPRKHAFCAHVILNKYKMLVVPDATKDFRFKDNPLVTDGTYNIAIVVSLV
jgi:GAF domain-containing protein